MFALHQLTQREILAGRAFQSSITVPRYEHENIARRLVAEIIPLLIYRMLENVHFASEILARSVYSLQILNVNGPGVAEG